MKNNLLTFILCCLTMALTAQKPYFQQEVNYKINVTLIDTVHTLKGDIEIAYTNNSPDELNELYFHLWPNAFKNNKTEFAKQKYEEGSTRFWNAKDDDRGYIDDLDFNVNGKTVKWSLNEKNIDIALLTLNQPLKSGETITVKTPFRVRIPNSYSRLGHVKTSYQMTQWYPKPAVYDRDGWHPMPYLDQGEFYSEFGSFDVTITLPENYVVGATGVLQTESEVQFLNELAEKTEQRIKTDESFLDSDNEFPASSSEMKTIRYTAERVHDFAWFADKRFRVQKGEVVLESGRKIDTWVMYTATEADLWKTAIDYVNRSVKYYSERIGEYPYPHATAVQSALSAGAGMEYPMITVIGKSGNGKSLDQVITHEVGHNWFYGILASNERDHVWMDEGFNSYYEGAYMKEYYEMGSRIADFVPEGADRFLRGNDLEQDIGYTAYLIQIRRGEFVEPSSDSRYMTGFNYGLLGYMYPAYLFRYAEAYLGTDEFDRVMKIYYDQWKFKHPHPNDAKAIFEKETGKDFDWLFNDLFGSKKQMDYAMSKVTTNDAGAIDITVINKNLVNGPFSISGLVNGVVMETVWYDGFSGTKTVQFPKEYDGYRIDALGLMPENNRYNNYIKHSGGKANLPKLKLLAGLDEDQRKIYVLPALGVNAHDGFMLGAIFYNAPIQQKAFEYTIMPMYGFKSDHLTGIAEFDFYKFPKADNFEYVKAGVQLKSFGTFDSEVTGLTQKYIKIQPHAELKFQKNARSTTSKYFRVRGMYIQEELNAFDDAGNFTGLEMFDRLAYELSYELNNDRVTYPYSLKVNFLGNQYGRRDVQINRDARLTLEGKYKYTYSTNKNRGIQLRVFAGQFLMNDRQINGWYPMVLTGDGDADYFYDNLFLGRGRNEGLVSQQFTFTQGGFRTPMPAQSLGESNATMLTFNVELQAPVRFIPLSLFFDYGLFDDTRSVGDGFTSYTVAGVSLNLFNGLLSVNYPFAGTEELMLAYNSQGGFFNRLSFTLDLKKLNPRDLLRKNI